MRGVDMGVVELEGTLSAPFLATDGTGVAADPAVAPTFRVYGQGDELMANGTGSLGKGDTGAVTGATNASPVAIASAAHGLQTGTTVTVSGVVGNAGANGTFRVTRVDPDHFTLDGSSGGGAYVSGGVWHVTGLYLLTLPVPGGTGYEAGRTYHVLVAWRLGTTDYAALCPFRVG